MRIPGASARVAISPTVAGWLFRIQISAVQPGKSPMVHEFAISTSRLVRRSRLARLQGAVECSRFSPDGQ